MYGGVSFNLYFCKQNITNFTNLTKINVCLVNLTN